MGWGAGGIRIGSGGPLGVGVFAPDDPKFRTLAAVAKNGREASPRRKDGVLSIGSGQPLKTFWTPRCFPHFVTKREVSSKPEPEKISRSFCLWR